MNSETICLKALIKNNISSLYPSIDDGNVIETLNELEDFISFIDENGNIEHIDHNHQIRCTYISQNRGVKMFSTGDSFIDAYFNLVDKFNGDDQYSEFSVFTTDDYIKFTQKLIQDDAKLVFDIANSTYTWGYVSYINDTYDSEYETPESESVLSEVYRILCTCTAYFNDRDTLYSHLLDTTESVVWGDYDHRYGSLLKVNASSILNARQRICEFIDHFSKQEWFQNYSKIYYSKVDRESLKSVPFFYDSYETGLLKYRLQRMFTSNPTLQTGTWNGITTDWINLFTLYNREFHIDSTVYSYWNSLIPVPVPTTIIEQTKTIPTPEPSKPSKPIENNKDDGFVEVQKIGSYKTVSHPVTTKMWHAKCFNCYTMFDVPFWILNSPNDHTDKRVCPCCSKIGINYKKCKKCNKNYFISNIQAYTKCPTCKC